MLLAFALGTTTNAMLWITFASISSETKSLFQVSSTSVNTLSVIFMFCYLPGTLPVLYILCVVSCGRSIASEPVPGRSVPFVGPMFPYQRIPTDCNVQDHYAGTSGDFGWDC